MLIENLHLIDEIGTYLWFMVHGSWFMETGNEYGPKRRA
jgi:hypothetical protein